MTNEEQDALHEREMLERRRQVLKETFEDYSNALVFWRRKFIELSEKEISSDAFTKLMTTRVRIDDLGRRACDVVRTGRYAGKDQIPNLDKPFEPKEITWGVEHEGNDE